MDNVEFPWNTVLDLTAGSPERGVVVALNAVHEQLCVVADLLRGSRANPQVDDA